MSQYTLTRKNACVHDEHIGKTEKRDTFYHENERYCFVTDLTTGFEFFRKEVRPNKWVLVENPSLDLQMAYELRRSRRLM